MGCDFGADQEEDNVIEKSQRVVEEELGTLRCGIRYFRGQYTAIERMAPAI